jgi:hypothetical protein
MIDMASVFADRYRKTPNVLSSAVMGQSPDPELDPYTALNALKLVNESNRMAMAGQAQQPTSSPSIVAQNVAPPMQRGLGAMVPGAMGGQGMPPQGMPPQGMPPQGMPPQGMPQQTMQAASGGLAGMYSPEEDYAEGGIIAFQDRGYVDPAYAANSAGPVAYAGSSGDAVSADPLADYIATIAGGDGAPSSTAIDRAEKALNKYMDFAPKEMSEKEQEAFLDRYMARVKKAGGEDIYAPEIARGAQDEADRAKARQVGEANAYFTAAGKILKGRSLAEGASEALPAFGGAMNEVEKLDQAAKTANARAQFLLKDAQRKERMGDSRGAQAALAEARKFQQDANRAEGDKLRYGADIAARTVQYSRPAKATGSGEPKPPKLAERLYDDNLANLKLTEQPKEGETPAQFNARISAQAGELTARQVKDFGPAKAGSEEAKLTSKTDTDLDTRVAKEKIFDPAWQDAKTSDEKDAAETALRNRIIARRKTSGKPSDGGVNKNSTTAPDISTIKGAPAGSTIGKSTAKGWEVLDPAGTVIGYAQK